MSSWRIYSTRRGKAAFWTLLCLLTLCAGAVSLLVGAVELSPREVLDALAFQGEIQPGHPGVRGRRREGRR